MSNAQRSTLNAQRATLSAEDKREIEAHNAALRFAVSTARSGRVEILAFANPHDAEGTRWRLTPAERDELVFALSSPGFHAIARDDSEDRQLRLFTAEDEGSRKPGNQERRAA